MAGTASSPAPRPTWAPGGRRRRGRRRRDAAAHRLVDPGRPQDLAPGGADALRHPAQLLRETGLDRLGAAGPAPPGRPSPPPRAALIPPPPPRSSSPKPALTASVRLARDPVAGTATGCSSTTTST